MYCCALDGNDFSYINENIQILKIMSPNFSYRLHVSNILPAVLPLYFFQYFYNHLYTISLISKLYSNLNVFCNWGQKIEMIIFQDLLRSPYLTISCTQHSKHKEQRTQFNVVFNWYAVDLKTITVFIKISYQIKYPNN